MQIVCYENKNINHESELQRLTEEAELQRLAEETESQRLTEIYYEVLNKLQDFKTHETSPEMYQHLLLQANERNLEELLLTIVIHEFNKLYIPNIEHELPKIHNFQVIFNNEAIYDADHQQQIDEIFELLANEIISLKPLLIKSINKYKNYKISNLIKQIITKINTDSRQLFETVALITYYIQYFINTNSFDRIDECIDNIYITHKYITRKGINPKRPSIYVTTNEIFNENTSKLMCQIDIKKLKSEILNNQEISNFMSNLQEKHITNTEIYHKILDQLSQNKNNNSYTNEEIREEIKNPKPYTNTQLKQDISVPIHISRPSKIEI
jgi:hypothetical protein